MPNLLVHPKRALEIRIRNFFFKMPKNIDCLVVSPGGCGTVNLNKHLNNYTKSNLYLEKKYKKFGLGHLFKPPKSFYDNKIKVIIIKRNLNDIYKSIKNRGYIKNSLYTYGDLFPFIYVNIFKNDQKLKKKFINYIGKFYNNWKKYPSNLKLELNYKKIYSDKKDQKKIEKFLNIKKKKFLTTFPKFKRYKYNRDFIDPSTKLARRFY